MDKVLDFMKELIINNNKEIIIGVIIGIIVALIGIVSSTLLKIFKLIKKRLFPEPLPEPEEQAVYLNIPEKSFDDNCIGRDKLLDEVFYKITDGKKIFFRKNAF